MSDRIKNLKKALEKQPDNPLGLYGLALELFKEQKYDEAILYLLKYIDIHEDEGSAYRLLAQSYLNIGDVEKAIEYYEKGIKQAEKFNHQSMVEEFKAEVERLKTML